MIFDCNDFSINQPLHFGIIEAVQAAPGAQLPPDGNDEYQHCLSQDRSLVQSQNGNDRICLVILFSMRNIFMRSFVVRCFPTLGRVRLPLYHQQDQTFFFTCVLGLISMGDSKTYNDPHPYLNFDNFVDQVFQLVDGCRG